MSVVRRVTVAGEPCKLVHLPPAWPEWIERFRAFTRSDPIGVLGLDVETTAIEDDPTSVFAPFNPAARLRMVQLGTEREAWSIDPANAAWHRELRYLFTGEHPYECNRFVSHTNYDPLWIARAFGTDLAEQHRAIDTMPMAALLWPGERRPKDLKYLTAKLIDSQLAEAEAALLARFKELAPTGQRAGVRAPKAWGFTNIDLRDPVFGLYGGLDALYVRRLLSILAAKLRETPMVKLSRREQHIANLATGMSQRGNRVDLHRAREVLAEIEGTYQRADAELNEVLGFSPRSTLKRAAWLAEHGVRFTKRTAAGTGSVTKDTLPAMIAANADNDEALPVLENLLVLSENQNVMNNLRSIVAGAEVDGRIHPLYKTQAAVTGRMSIVRPAMQTFKKSDKRLRGVFIADEGTVLITADYASQEIRLAAAYSRDPALLRIVADGLNQHHETAKMIFPGRYRDKEANPEEYKAAKVLDFAQQYGAGPRTIGDQLGYRRRADGGANPKATDLWVAWREAYAGLVSWTEKLSTYRYVVNPWGRVIPADDWRGYANGNYVIQSSGRDLLGDAMVKFAEAGWAENLWLPVHDELVIQVPEDQAEEAGKILEDCMFARVKGIEMIATAEILGQRWSGE